MPIIFGISQSNILQNPRTITINNIEFTPIEGVDYRIDYVQMFDAVASGKYPELAMWRHAILNDLWFILYFVMGIKDANHPFVVKQCQMVENGPQSDTMDIWARFHFKSTIITTAETLQFHLKNPEACTGIIAYSRPAAKKFLRGIKRECEESVILKACFPDILYQNPVMESPKWSEDDGIVFKRKSSSRGEGTIEAWGLTEGMPTGRHFERLVFDDLETEDIKDSPDMLNKVWSNFQMAAVNLLRGKDTDITRVIGTYYSHCGPNVNIENMKYPDGKPIYQTRKIPGSDTGLPNGKPVLMDEKSWIKAQASGHFNSQQLCDPTPKGDRKLSREMLNEIHPDDIPKNIPSFLLVDWAGDATGKDSDSWAIATIGIDPNTEDLRTSKIYITDLCLSPMKEPQAVDMIIKMYLRNYVEAIAVEKINSGILGLHVAGILNDKYRKRITEADKTLIYLKPASRDKKQRISTALEIPFLNGNVHISTFVDNAYRDRLKQEMDNFPMWHDDGLDMLSYLYDILADPFWQARLRVYQKPKDINPLRRMGHLSLVGGGYNKTWMAA